MKTEKKILVDPKQTVSVRSEFFSDVATEKPLDPRMITTWKNDIKVSLSHLHP